MREPAFWLGALAVSIAVVLPVFVVRWYSRMYLGLANLVAADVVHLSRLTSRNTVDSDQASPSPQGSMNRSLLHND